MLWLYLLILLVLAAALWGVYRLLGTPSKLTPRIIRSFLRPLRSAWKRPPASSGRFSTAHPPRIGPRPRRKLAKFFRPATTRRFGSARPPGQIRRRTYGPSLAGLAKPTTGPAGWS